MYISVFFLQILSRALETYTDSEGSGQANTPGFCVPEASWFPLTLSLLVQPRAGESEWFPGGSYAASCPQPCTCYQKD